MSSPHSDRDGSLLRLSGRRVAAVADRVGILVDSVALQAIPGETIAAAMSAAGVAAFGQAPGGAPLGLACGMGACLTCLVTVDGARRARACLTPVVEGMRVETGSRPGAGSVREDAAAPVDADTAAAADSDVVVIGAGPAGLAAARMLAAAGLTVTVLDERPSPGGQYFKPLAAGHRFRAGQSGDRQFRDGAALVKAARRAGVVFVGEATVWDARLAGDGRPLVTYDRQGRSHALAARHLVIATGAVERPWPVPGWTLPGAMTTGAAQTLARAYRVAAGRRILVAGNGPLNLQLADELAAGGALVVAVAEAAGHPASASPVAHARMLRHRPALVRDGLTYLARLAAARVPVLWRHVLVGITGEDAVSGAILARIDAEGAILPGSERRFAVDCVTMGYGFQPAGEIARLIGCAEVADPRGSGSPVARIDERGRTSIAGVYLAGDCAGAWGAGRALAQGEIVAADILSERRAPRGSVAPSGRRAREEAFQNALWRVFAARLPPARALADDATMVCRCEGLRLGDLRAALSAAALDLAAVKRRTRCGMGLCQGRYCLPLLQALAAGAGGLPVAQAPLRPVAIGSIVACSGQPASGRAPEPPPARSIAGGGGASVPCDVLIIGGGIIGVCALYETARAGLQAVLVEGRRAVGAEASGANAGSLHVQSLAYALEDFESPAARAALALLPLQRDSALLWRSLAAELGADLEVEITGGLCVADEAAGLAKLSRKAEAERAAGIDVTVIGPSEARRLLPGLADGVLAATYSPDEGKLNPLTATAAIADAARAAGARLDLASPVTGIVRDGAGYRVTTAAAVYRAGRIVIAAGSGSAALAEMLGVSLPISATPLQMIVTERMPPRIDLLLSHVSRRLTVKQARSGNIIIGGGWRCGADGAGRLRPEIGGLGGNLEAAVLTLPDLAATSVIRSWVAVNGLPRGGPMLGELPGAPGCLVAVALNGLTLGPVFGRLLADLVRGRKPGWDVSDFAPERRLQ